MANIEVAFTTSEAQKKRIKSAAKKAKVSMAEWLRQAVKAALKH